MLDTLGVYALAWVDHVELDLALRQNRCVQVVDAIVGDPFVHGISCLYMTLFDFGCPYLTCGPYLTCYCGCLYSTFRLYLTWHCCCLYSTFGLYLTWHCCCLYSTFGPYLTCYCCCLYSTLYLEKVPVFLFVCSQHMLCQYRKRLVDWFACPFVWAVLGDWSVD
jgi:hypothetical protein